VLVDEFQDTNAIQYKWLMLLAGPGGLPFAVGDDDQSIYRWRGARVENLNQVPPRFPQAVLYKLEQNYRSTGTILKAANALIAQQRRPARQEPVDQRRGRRSGQAVCRLQRARRGRFRRESHPRVGGARRRAARGRRAVSLERAVAGVRRAFLNARMPYRVYGGLRFFERAEIKDALAYLRLVASRADDTSFERVVNLPTRGIGAKTLDTLRETARERRAPRCGTAGIAVQGALPQRAAQALQVFCS
jgi:DNA helicase-2/ATP-dependent DNA helicase PcrA